MKRLDMFISLGVLKRQSVLNKRKHETIEHVYYFWGVENTLCFVSLCVLRAEGTERDNAQCCSVGES